MNWLASFALVGAGTEMAGALTTTPPNAKLFAEGLGNLMHGVGAMAKVKELGPIMDAIQPEIDSITAKIFAHIHGDVPPPQQ